MIRTVLKLLLGAVFILPLVACDPTVGSKEWCENMVEKPKADWTANQAKDFAKHCVFK
ncbi:MAG: DUF3012 domain-containing protein [Proteobacteria bacterium]|nr:DUF3012 domain-containing protein [Pseudomonadota bacterium]